jgi:hypothetical protein
MEKHEEEKDQQSSASACNDLLCASFVFAEFKNVLKSVKSNLFQLPLSVFTSCRLRRILLKQRSHRVVWVTAILLPCLIYGYLVFGGQVGLEGLKGFQMAVNVTKPQKFAKVVATSEVPDVSIVSQKSDFWEESISKEGSSFIKFLSSIPTYAKAMTYQKAEQQCYERESRTGQNLNCDSFHYADLIVYFLLGFLLAKVIPIVWGRSHNVRLTGSRIFRRSGAAEG